MSNEVMIERAASDFAFSLAWLRAGARVSRAGWNGKGMWLALVGAGEYVVLNTPRELGAGLKLLPWIGMRTADNGFVPWLASQTDILANDWGVVD